MVEIIKGIDVSIIQGETIDWQAVADHGIRFAFLKSSEGMGPGDRSFRRNADACRKVGIAPAPYHFGRCNLSPGMRTLEDDAIGEALRLVGLAGDVGQLPGDMAPAADIETKCGQTDAWVAKWARVHLDEIEAHFGRVPWHYGGLVDAQTGEPMAGVHALLDRATHNPLWRPMYRLLEGGRAPTFEEAAKMAKPQLAPWGDPRIWQFSGGDNRLRGNTIPGIKGWVDCNLLYASESEFLEMIGLGPRDAAAPETGSPIGES